MERFTRNEQLTNAAVIIQSLNSDATKTVFPLTTARHMIQILLLSKEPLQACIVAVL